MYRALFVDDESLVREGVSSRVDWNAHGFDLVQTCANGQQATEVLDSVGNIQLVVSDICMPVMDGIGLCRHISLHHPDVVVVLLTGYEQFSYAQQAVKYHVQELVLKPVTAVEMGDLLDKMEDVVSKRIADHRERELLLHRATEGIDLVRQRLLTRWTTEIMDVEVLEYSLQNVGLPTLLSCQLCVIVDLGIINSTITSGWHQSKSDKLLLELQLDSHDSAFVNKNGNHVLVFQNARPEGFELKIRQRCLKLRDEICSIPGREVSIGIGRIAPDAAHVCNSCMEAETALQYRSVLGNNQVVQYAQLLDSNETIGNSGKIIQEVLSVSLRSKPAADSKAAITRYFEQIGTDRIALAQAQAQTILLFGSIVTFAEDAGVPLGALADPIAEGFSMIAGGQTREDIEKWFHKLIDELHVQLKMLTMEQTEHKIQRAIQYVRDNLADRNLTVQSVCEKYNLSPSHFSNRFKRLVGKTFVDFLTSIRMEQASMLLKTTNLCAYEIAPLVGYEDPHYFSQVFKKQTGMTVSKYRSEVGDNLSSSLLRLDGVPAGDQQEEMQ